MGSHSRSSPADRCRAPDGRRSVQGQRPGPRAPRAPCGPHLGPRAEAQQANEDSFYFTNISPQINSFNQSSRGGLWGRLEDTVYDQVEVDRLRLSVFGGPVFHDDDREYRGVRVPREFWKVLAYTTDGQLTTKAFLLTQNLDRLETLDLQEFKTYQLTLDELTERTGVQFAPALTEQPAPEALAEPRVVESPSDVLW
ncbi:DNA/RNA non-specific endonuclease [Kocuria carniphila]|uniref:DNA/RNA non-specific endonuclease n=1 Tax=Kocuria carniphila TaxID=262208 RepID=UPI0034CF260C